MDAGKHPEKPPVFESELPIRRLDLERALGGGAILAAEQVLIQARIVNDDFVRPGAQRGP